MEKSNIVGDNESSYLFSGDKGFCLVDINSLDIMNVNRKGDIEDFLNARSRLPYYVGTTPIEEDDGMVSVTFVTGFDCNYRCDYCYQKKRGRYIDKRLSKENIDSIVLFYEWLGNVRKKKYIISEISIVGGEPLLVENYETIKYIFDIFPKARLHVTTNGTHLSDYFDLILENKNRIDIKISLDGVKEYHYKKRKPSSNQLYDMAIEGIKMLVNENVNIQISCVYDSKCNQYSDFFDKLEELGWLRKGNIQVNFLPQIEYGSDVSSVEEVLENVKSIKGLIESDERVKEVNYDKICPGWSRFKRAVRLYQNKMYEPYRCEALYKPSYTFFPDGTIHFCLACMDEKGIVGYYEPSFCIKEKLIEALKSRRIDVDVKCKECKYRVFCLGGCPATALKKTDDICGHFCELWTDDTILKCVDEIYG